MKIPPFLPAGFRVLLAGCAALGLVGRSWAGSDSAVAPDVRPLSIRLDEYLKSQHVEHAVETAAAGDTMLVKVYEVASASRQDAICAGLILDAKRDRLLQNVTVQFLSAETTSAVVQNYQPSSLPSGNGTVVSTQRVAETTKFKLLRAVKLQEVAAK